MFEVVQMLLGMSEVVQALHGTFETRTSLLGSLGMSLCSTSTSWVFQGLYFQVSRLLQGPLRLFQVVPLMLGIFKTVTSRV